MGVEEEYPLRRSTDIFEGACHIGLRNAARGTLKMRSVDPWILAVAAAQLALPRW